jgi:hypothetical protein
LKEIPVEVGKEHLWLKASWTRLDLIPCGQAYVHKIYTITYQQLRVLLQ